MRVILTTIWLFLFVSATVLAQDEFSESAVYKPRKIVPIVEKQKKEKKQKNRDERNQNSAPVEQPLTKIEANTPDETSAARRIAVTVFDDAGNHVKNLQKSDFKVFVDDKEQEISAFGTSDEPLNVVLMVDVSPSTAYEIEAIRNYVNALVAQFKPQDKVLVIGFAGGTVALTDLTSDREIIGKAVKKLKFGDGTSLYEAVKFSVQKRISLIKGRKMVVLLTDGVDTTSAAATFEDSLLEAEKDDAAFYPLYIDTSKNANRRATNGTYIPGVGTLKIGDRIALPNFGTDDLKEEYERGRNYLADLAALSGGQVVVTDIGKTKRTGFENIFEAFRNQFYLNFSATEKEINGQRRQIKVRVNRPNLTVLARGSYPVKEKQ